MKPSSDIALFTTTLPLIRRPRPWVAPKAAQESLAVACVTALDGAPGTERSLTVAHLDRIWPTGQPWTVLTRTSATRVLVDASDLGFLGMHRVKSDEDVATRE
jgi:hypothetical protein